MKRIIFIYRKRRVMKKSLQRIFPIIIIYFLSCVDNDENNCNDCGKSSDEGYLLKIVEVNDIANLAVIGVTAELGTCINFRIEIEDQTFSEATVVPDCCCSQFE
jgi:hypothetical protein